MTIQAAEDRSSGEASPFEAIQSFRDYDYHIHFFVFQLHTKAIATTFVGRFVGCFVGSFVGVIVGIMVGSIDGWLVGI